MRTLREKFGRRLFAFAVRLTGDTSWAEDIVQVTLIRAWRSRDKIINDGETACGWLFTVARRVFHRRVSGAVAASGAFDRGRLRRAAGSR